MPNETDQPVKRSFAHVDTWVFDLDNTLYPRKINLWQQVDQRIRDYVAQYLNVPPEEAYRIQKDYYQRYGTTMRGMMTEHGVSAEDYLGFVHQIDHSPLEPDPALGASIERLPGRKLILTNGTVAHAKAVLERLEIHHHFEDVFDIIAAELEPKPSARAYERFFAKHAIAPERGAMFEDLARNLEVPHQRGMVTVFVTSDSAEPSGRQPWEIAGADAPYVDYVTDDLAGFLANILA